MKKTILEIIDYPFDWEFGTKIEDVKDDIEKMEDLGATHIEIEMFEKWGDTYIKFIAYKRRFETDEEEQKRELNELMLKEAKEKEEFELYKKLHQKFGEETKENEG